MEEEAEASEEQEAVVGSEVGEKGLQVPNGSELGGLLASLCVYIHLSLPASMWNAALCFSLI